jgi:exopolysaccharide biosynthesis polyprenyl glycosylphosphotransferase
MGDDDRRDSRGLVGDLLEVSAAPPRFERGDEVRVRPRPRQAVRRAIGIHDGTAPAAAHARDAALRRLLALADLLAMSTALAVGVNLAGGPRLELAGLLVLPLACAAAWSLRLYERDALVLSKATLRESSQIAQLASTLLLLLYLGQHWFATGPITLLQGIAVWATCFASAMVARSLVRRLHLRSATPDRCLVLGPRERASRVEEKLAHEATSNATVVATIDPDELPKGPECGAVLAETVRRHDVHRVIVASSALDNEDVLEIVRDMKALGIKVTLKPPLMGVVGSAVVFDDVHGDVFLGVRRFGLTRSEQRVKRAMDIVGAGLALIAVAPVIAVVALAIKLDSRGPVFFRQKRIGRDGERFCIIKFRTMVPDAEARKAELRHRGAAAGGLFKLEDDPRVTRVGRLLRRTSLDELPQLVNVLRGEMSLVGPRPLVLDEDEQIVGWHRRRLHLTPGVTGAWQVLGSTRVPLRDMVALDYLYIVNWSPWRDVEIALRTVAYMLGRRGV